MDFSGWCTTEWRNFLTACSIVCEYAFRQARVGGGDLLYHEWFFYSIRLRPKVKATLRRGLGVFIITQEDWKSLTIARWKSKGSFSSVISRPWVVIQPTTTSFIWQQGIEPGPKSAPSKSPHLSYIPDGSIKGAVSQQSSSFCFILPFTCPQSLWNLK